jgi:rare lipoprotein A
MIKKTLIAFGISLIFIVNTNAKFADIDTTHPYFHAIDFLQNEKIIKGFEKNGERFFRPLQKVTRAEALKVLISSAEIPTEKNQISIFSDVPQNSWFAPFVNAASTREIIKGFADGKFHPSAQVSRAEFAKMVALSFEMSVVEAKLEEKWFEPFMQVLEELNLLPNKESSPYESLSRGEMAEIIYRVEQISEQGFSEEYSFSGTGLASYYNEGFAGKKTASGEIYDPMDLTAAHRTLPFGTRLKVSYGENFVIVRINDRGPYHENRIIDLSQKAFERLAPISKGVLSVNFEVFSDLEKSKVSVPETIRPEISTIAKNPVIPTVVATETNFAFENKEEKDFFLENQKTRTPTQPYFNETIVNLPEDFFPNATLRAPIPQKLVLGTVMNFSGTALEAGHKVANVFLQNVNDKSIGQQHFMGSVSGKNFVIPVAFLSPGKFNIGLVFDDKKQSRVEVIEVVSVDRERKFASSDVSFSSDLEIKVIPETKMVSLSWATGVNRLTKMIFSQKNTKVSLQIESGISAVEVPFDFFKKFVVDENCEIDVWQADSSKGTLSTQNTNWKKVAFKNLKITAGFPDFENKKVVIRDFQRYLHNLTPITFYGEILEDVELRENVYLTTPSGFVKEIPIQKNGTNQFYARIAPEEFGIHIFEIVSKTGEILFNRAVYFSEDEVFPVALWAKTPIRSNSVVGVRNWINQFRRKYEVDRVFSNAELDDFAQAYAEEMNSKNFISHITPDGETFETRIKNAGFKGEFGENLSFGSTLPLALSGLENSGSHRENLLSQKWKYVGIGVSKNEKGQFYVAQLFSK